MALAWVTHAVNATEHRFTILQNDPSWHPIVDGHQFGQDEPIEIAPAAGSAVTDFTLKYCVVPWQGFGRLRVVGPNGNYVDYEVGTFVHGDKDHLRGVLNTGEIPLLVELGGTGGAWWSSSYDFGVYVNGDQGLRWNIDSITNSPLPGIVNGVAEALKEVAPKLLDFLTA